MKEYEYIMARDLQRVETLIEILMSIDDGCPVDRSERVHMLKNLYKWKEVLQSKINIVTE